MDKRKRFGGEDHTGATTWPRGLKNPAAELRGPMTTAKGEPKSGPIGESVKYVAGGASWAISKVAEASRKLAESMVQGQRTPKPKTK